MLLTINYLISHPPIHHIVVNSSRWWRQRSRRPLCCWTTLLEPCLWAGFKKKGLHRFRFKTFISLRPITDRREFLFCAGVSWSQPSFWWFNPGRFPVLKSCSWCHRWPVWSENRWEGPRPASSPLWTFNFPSIIHPLLLPFFRPKLKPHWPRISPVGCLFWLRPAGRLQTELIPADRWADPHTDLLRWV